MNPKTQEITTTLIRQWFLSQPDLPRMREYISPRVDNLSLKTEVTKQTLSPKPSALSKPKKISEPLPIANAEINQRLIKQAEKEIKPTKTTPRRPNNDAINIQNQKAVKTEKTKSALINKFNPLFYLTKRYVLMSLLIILIGLLIVLINFYKTRTGEQPVPHNVNTSSKRPIELPIPKPLVTPENTPNNRSIHNELIKTGELKAILPTFTLSPKTLWHRFYHVGENNGANALCVMPDNSLIVGGWTQKPEHLDGFVLKLDQKGNVLWQQTFGGDRDDSVRGLHIVPNGGVIGVGYKSYLYVGEQEKDFWVFKLKTETGAMLWKKIFGGRQNDSAIALDVFSNGDIIVAGWTDSQGMGKADGWLFRLNSQNGQTLWQKTLGSTEADVIRAVQITSDDHILMAGGTQSPYSHWNAWLLKLNSQGRKIWEKTYGGQYEAQAHALQIMPEGDLVVAGYIKKSASRDQDVWIARFNSDGSQQRWQEIWGSTGLDRANTLQLTSDDGILVAGESHLKRSKESTAWLLKLDDRGQESWKQTIAGLKGKAYALQTTSHGELVMTGYSQLFGEKRGWVLKLGE